MRKRTRVRLRFWAAIFSFVAALSFSFAVTSAAGCYAYRYPDGGEYHECIASVFGLLSELAGWLGDHLEAIGIVVTGVFTWFVARYTRELAASTEKLFLAGEQQIAVAKLSAEAAGKSADAAMAAERAWIACIMDANNLGNVLMGARLYDNSPEMNDGAVEKPRATFFIENFGKTRASITSIRVGEFICASEPPDLVYSEHAIPYRDQTLAVNTSTEAIYVIGMTLPFTHGEGVDVVQGGKWLWCGLQIEYRDVFGNPHVSRLYCRSNNRIRFQQYDYKHYNQST